MIVKIMACFVLFASFNTQALDCKVKTDSNADGNFNKLVTNVKTVLDGDMVFILKNGSVHRQNNSQFKMQKIISPDNSELSPISGIAGAKLLAFGTRTSNVVVTAKHVRGTTSDFESTSAVAYDFTSPFGILIDYKNNLSVTCTR